MTKVISISVFAGAFMASFFGSSTLFCVLLAVAAAALFIFDLFLFKNSKIKKTVVSILSIALAVICVMIPSKAQSYGSDDYWDKVEDYMNAVLDENSKEAEKLYAEIAVNYGQTDDIRYFKGLSLLPKKDMEGLYEILESFDNKTTCNYYMLKEKYIGLKYLDDIHVGGYEFKDLYKEAVKYNPGWGYALKNLGVIYLDESQYEEACYYLTKAFLASKESDGENAYYIGVAMFEQGLYDEAFKMFEKAYNLGVSEEIQGYIATYCSYYATGKEE